MPKGPRGDVLGVDTPFVGMTHSGIIGPAAMVYVPANGRDNRSDEDERCITMTAVATGGSDSKHGT